MTAYDLHSKFDLTSHKEKFINYLEVVIFPDGHIEYAVPSHTRKLEDILSEQKHMSVSQVRNLVPPEKRFDYLDWLCEQSGCVSVWTNYIVCPSNSTQAQHDTINRLIKEGVLKLNG